MSSKNYLPPQFEHAREDASGDNAVATVAAVPGTDHHFVAAIVRAVESNATFSVSQGGVDLVTALPVDAGQTVTVGPFSLASGDNADLVLTVVNGGASATARLIYFDAPAD